MTIEILYKGALEKEIIICKDCWAHSSGGWYVEFINDKENIFISSADVRKIRFIKE